MGRRVRGGIIGLLVSDILLVHMRDGRLCLCDKLLTCVVAQNMTKAKDRLEVLKRGGPKQQKTRISRSQVGKGKDDCVVM